jgi:predicted permease
MTRLLQNLRHGFQIHAKNPVLSSTILLTVAISVGSGTAVFSVVNAILLKPLPYPEAEKIVIPWRLAPKDVNLGYEEIPWGTANFQRIARDNRSFQSLAAFKGETFNLTGAGQPVLLEGVKASAGFFSALGVEPLIGRLFTPEGDAPGHEHEAVLSYDVWQNQFFGKQEIVGRTIDLNGQPYTVTGVMPRAFSFPRGEEMPRSFGFPRRTQIWTLLALPAVAPPYAPDELAIIGRLKQGISISNAQAEMQILRNRMEQDEPEMKGWFNSRLTTLNRQVAGNTRMPLLLTLGAAALVSLIACSNIGNLLLARALSRSTEFAIRSALGANRSGLVLQLLTESLLLAAAGGLLGLLFADEAIHLVKAFGPPNVPRLQEATLDVRVFAFASSAALLSGILSGLVPAVACSRGQLVETLRAGARSAGSAAKVTVMRNSLLVAEVALALVLVIASGLLTQTFFRLLHRDPGFRAAHVFTFEMSLPSTTYRDDEQIVRFYQRALEALQSSRGIAAAGVTEMAPMSGATDGTRVRLLAHNALANQYPVVSYTIASPGYFSAVGTPVLRGRPFMESDNDGAQPVAIINQSMARKMWPGQDPIGQRLALASDGSPWMTVVGVVQDVKHLSLREGAGPEMYVPFTQKPFPSMRIMQFVVRGDADLKWLASSVQAAISSLDSDLPVGKVTTLRAIVQASVAGQRFSTVLLGAFALISLLLAASGMYGVISYWVNQRTREIGVRMVLGATRGNVLGMVVGQGIRLACTGILVGLVSAIGVTRVMASVLYGIGATDAPTFAGVSLILLAVATLACYLPALRATHVDPTIALRHE